MPFVRGRIIPEAESAGRAKSQLDVLFWLKNADHPDTLKTFDELEHLRIYLDSFQPSIASIRFLVPLDDQKINAVMKANIIGHYFTPKSNQFDRIPKRIREGLSEDLAVLASTALGSDADCIVTDVAEWLPYVEEFEEIGIYLTTPGLLLLRYCELFVRGHNLPWAFGHKVWFEPWTAFYQLSEPTTFRQGMELLNLAAAKKAPSDARDVGRSLVFNRLGDICFTRDRLLFHEMQQAVSKRARWKRQRFATEIAYHLNFYYLLLFGAFDHAAVFVNALLSLGVKEKRVSARGQEFLSALQAKSPKMHAIFDNKDHKSFITKIAAVRHVAAHRGVITPTKVVQEPDHEPTNDELDEDIRKAGLEDILMAFPVGPAREGFREMMRTNARMARYEEQTLMEDVLLIEVDGKWGWINPLLDTSWNFNRCMDFLADVFTQCAAELT
jgi:hypothetical protein